MRFWVRLSHLGLGFWIREERRAAGRRREKKENESEKMKGNRVRTFYIRRWTGWVLTRSSAPRFKPLDLGPDGSGSIQRPVAFWRSGSINQHGFGPGTLGFLVFFSVFLICCYIHPCSCYLDHLRLNFSQKFQKNYYVFLTCFDCFVIFYMPKIGKK